MPFGGWLVVYALAVARLTGLITLDEITRPIRLWAIRRLPIQPWAEAAEYLITCPWCASLWLALITAPAIYLWGDTPWLQLPALAFALSQVTGMTAQLGRSDRTV